jgi:hypothetical protein
MHPEPRPWKQLIGHFRDKLDATLDLAAEHVKDAMLDWNAADDNDDGSCLRMELPPLSREEVRAILRDRMDTALDRILDLLGDVNNDGVDERLDEIVSELTSHMLETGRRLQRKDAEAFLFPYGPPQGEWARRFRQIQAENTLHQ